MTTSHRQAAGRREDWPAGPAREGPLRGLRVLDLTRVLAGPLATMQLADLGADVVKVETPGRGDETRHWGPPFTAAGISSYYLAVNHNKRSLTLALDDSRSQAVARRLALAADVVVDNFLPGRLAAFGLDRASLADENPGVVTCTVSGFGSGNAYSDRPGYDFIAQAMGGFMSITGPAGGEPTRAGVAITDGVSGLQVDTGVLAALVERGLTGVGRHVEVSLLDSQVALLVNLASGWLTAGVQPELFGNAHPSICPYETLPTADGELAFAVGTDRQFLRLVTALGAPELATDPRFATNADRVRNRPVLRAELEQRLGAHPRQHWLDVLVGLGVPVGPVNRLAEVFADPVVSERMVVQVDGTRQLRTPIRLDGLPLAVHSTAPALGEHTDDILGALGVSAQQVAEMRGTGAI